VYRQVSLTLVTDPELGSVHCLPHCQVTVKYPKILMLSMCIAVLHGTCMLLFNPGPSRKCPRQSCCAALVDTLQQRTQHSATFKQSMGQQADNFGALQSHQPTTQQHNMVSCPFQAFKDAQGAAMLARKNSKRLRGSPRKP
jgi:hypothetical protein